MSLSLIHIYPVILLKPYYRFQEQDEYSLWLNSKCNVRHCDVLVQNKTSDSLNYFALYQMCIRDSHYLYPALLAQPDRAIAF